MSHEVETMAYANAVPWHGLGAQVDDSLTPSEFLVAAGLDWKVEQHPLFAEIGGEKIEIPGKFALIRDIDNKLMTVTSERWNPVQNAEALDFMTRYVSAGGAKMETAGSLRGGKVVWGLANLNHSYEVRPGDRVNGYLLLTSSHVVGMATTIRTTNVRVVCANTLAMAESRSSLNYRQNHLTSFNIEAAKAAVESAHQELAECERRSKVLDALKLSAEDAVRKVLLPVFEPELVEDELLMTGNFDFDILPDKIKAIMGSIKEAPGAIEDTGWGVLNGVTHWADHVQGRNNESRMYRSWVGDYSRRKLEVEQKLFELAAT